MLTNFREIIVDRYMEYMETIFAREVNEIMKGNGDD